MDLVAQESICRVNGALSGLGTSIHTMDGCWDRAILAIDRYGRGTLCHLGAYVMGLHSGICCLAFHAHLVLPTNRPNLPWSADSIDVGDLVPFSWFSNWDLKNQ